MGFVLTASALTFLIIGVIFGIFIERYWNG